MSDPYESSFDDLFDFPEVEGLEDFGLVPPVPAGMVQAEPEAQQPAQQPAQPDAQPQGEAPAAPAPAATPPPAPATAPTSSAARPNPPIPDDVTDLDEDLFHFDELFSLEDDPYQNGTLSVDGIPANDLFLDPTDAAAPPAAAPAAAAPAPAATQPEPEAPTEARAQAQAPVQEPAQAAQQATQPPPPAAAQPQPSPAAPAAPAAAPSAAVHRAPEPQMAPPPTSLPSSFPAETHGNEHMSAPTGAGPGHMLRDRGPRILLPEDIPYSETSEKQRLLWILVACFLFVNTGIFYVAHQASAAFRSSLQATTDKLADAIAQDKAAPAAAAPSHSDETSASVNLEPALTHTVTEQPSYDAGTNLPERSKRDRWIDPRDYANTHEFAVGNAKALLAEGRFEDARRLLNHVLANQGRIPLSPVLREEIDYLIPLTYFEQGNATAPTPEESL